MAKARVRSAYDIADPELNVAWGQRAGDSLSEEFATPSGSQEAMKTGSGIARETGDTWRMGARFFVPNPWLTAPRVSARKAELRAAQADERAARWLVECEARRLFAKLDYLTNDLALAGKLLCLDGDILRAAQARVEQHAATASDVVSAVQGRLQRQNDLDQIRRRFKLAQRGLAALLDMPVMSLQLATNAPACAPRLPSPPISFAQARAAALQHRGDLDALRWRMLAAGSAFREARNLRLPWIKEITGDYRASSRHAWGVDTPGGAYDEPSWISDTSDLDEWRVGLTIDIPIFSLVKNHVGEVLQAQYKLAGVNEAEGISRATCEIRDALDELDESLLQQSRYERELAPLAAEMRRTLEILGRTPNVMPEELAATEAQVVESLRLELRLRWQRELALIALESALGAPLTVTLNAGMSAPPNL